MRMAKLQEKWDIMQSELKNIYVSGVVQNRHGSIDL